MLHVVTTDINLHISGYSSAQGILCACVFLVTRKNQCQNDAGMWLCKFTFTIISSLPCLHTFWHAIPTSFYIFNVFKSCYINDHCGFVGFVSIPASLTKHFLVTFPCAGSDSFVQANLQSHSEYVGDLLEVWEPWFIVSSWLAGSLIPRPPPSFPSLAVRKSGRGPGTFPHVSDVTGRKAVEKL